MENLLGN
jgi:hypothetical protein